MLQHQARLEAGTKEAGESTIEVECPCTGMDVDTNIGAEAPELGTSVIEPEAVKEANIEAEVLANNADVATVDAGLMESGGKILRRSGRQAKKVAK
jgi:hypothetical protein